MQELSLNSKSKGCITLNINCSSQAHDSEKRRRMISLTLDQFYVTKQIQVSPIQYPLTGHLSIS